MSMEPSTLCSASVLWGIWRLSSSSSPGMFLTSWDWKQRADDIRPYRRGRAGGRNLSRPYIHAVWFHTRRAAIYGGRGHAYP